MTGRRGLLFQLFFALMLVFAQQQAISHALDHDFQRLHSSSRDVTGHDEAFCAKCVAIAQLGNAVNSASIDFDVIRFTPPRVAALRYVDVAPAFVGAYLSRAPPVLS